MSDSLTKVVAGDFDSVVAAAVEALGREGFGVLTDIDVKATLKKKLDVDFPNYRILGACNPPLAYQALRLEADVGTLLPCNVVVRADEAGRIVVRAVDPEASLGAADNPALAELAATVRAKLAKVVASL